MGLYDHWIDVQQNVPEDSEQWAHHAVQSIVWSAAGVLSGNYPCSSPLTVNAGCDRLAAIEEDIVTAFTEVAGDDNCTITVALNRAYRVSSFARELVDRALILVSDHHSEHARESMKNPSPHCSNPTYGVVWLSTTTSNGLPKYGTSWF